MAVNLSIKDVPEAVAERLRRRAARNHRSLQGELMAIVEQAAAETSVEGVPMALHTGAVPVRRTQGWKSVQQVAEEARRRFPQGTPSSVDDIRAMRDSRHGDDAAR